MRRRIRGPYAWNVISVQTGSSLATATAPLWANFGDDLTLWRDGNVVHWSYDGQTVIVAQQADGAATASFVDTPSVDVVSGNRRCRPFTAAPPIAATT